MYIYHRVTNHTIFLLVELSSILTAILFQPANSPPGSVTDPRPTLEKVASLDWIGGLLSVSTVICLLLPLQWGGVTRQARSVSETRIAMYLTLTSVERQGHRFLVRRIHLLIAFIAWEYRKGKDAMMPLSLFLNRSQVGASLNVIFSRIAFLGANYYLPFFYQAKGRSASQSGVDILPFMLSLILASIVGSGFVKRTGHYYAFLIIGPLFASIGAGLLITINEWTSSAKLVGYQIIFGAGMGISVQLPMLAIQAEYADRPCMVPQATSLIMFFQMLGGSIGVAIAGSVFNNQLSKELPKYAPSLPPKMVQLVKQSVTIIFELDPTLRSGVIHAYIKALDYIFIVAVPACILCAIASAFVRSWNVKTREEESRKPIQRTEP
ncbi:SubName: Full=Probable DHA14-like major facilitator ABC transporter {ECO:0000313/EMBL:CCA75809.1} [Serendipita indica DSM 11827]|nr:SubName: Full=Probable DHA14-like major facilitator ABC transporter {ECO:0000313/EMBL:CCA75809.1} [Serendipita indica DSM 11827]